MIKFLNHAAVAALAVSMMGAAPALAEPVPTTKEATQQQAHDMMMSMMDLFEKAFERAGLENDKLNKTLMARIESDITSFIEHRNELAEVELTMTALSPDACKAARAFLETPEGRDFLRESARARTRITYLTQAELEALDHDALMGSIHRGLMEEAAKDEAAKEPTMKLAAAIEELDQ